MKYAKPLPTPHSHHNYHHRPCQHPPHSSFTVLTNAHTIAHNTNIKPSCSKQINLPNSIFHPYPHLLLSLLPQTLFVLYHHYHHSNKWELNKKIVMKMSSFFCVIYSTMKLCSLCDLEYDSFQCLFLLVFLVASTSISFFMLLL